MPTPNETVASYVGDMIATERHIKEAIERQLDDEKIDNYHNARAVLERVDRVLEQHLDALNRRHEAMVGDSANRKLKEATTRVTGWVTGLYDKMRGEKVSRAIRDDYAALAFDSICYTMLHTTALAYQDRTTADLAMTHLKDLTPLVVEVSRLVPHVVAIELAEDEDEPRADASVADAAERNTQQAWSAEHVASVAAV